MKLILAIVVALLAGCGSDTGEVANVCEKSATCPQPGSPTPDHYGPISK